MGAAPTFPPTHGALGVREPSGASEGQHVEELDRLVGDLVLRQGVACSASIAIGQQIDGEFSFWVGAAGPSAGPEAVFDLASVTKPVTAMACLLTVARGQLRLDDRVGDVLPELAGASAAAATLGELLCHRAGLPAWGALYAQEPFALPAGVSVPADEPPALATMLAVAASRRDAGQGAVYSDLGYVLASAMHLAATGRAVSEGWSDVSDLATPDMRRGREAFDARVQPTEIVPFRGGEVRGVVHDENAWMLARRGFSAGHAGAFGTALEVARFGASVLEGLQGRGRLAPIGSELLERATVPASSVGTHGLGFDTKSPTGSSAGARVSPRAFGHLGFTGGSLWCDPDRNAVVALLTNRTFPTRANVRIRAARPRVHDAALDWLESRAK